MRENKMGVMPVNKLLISMALPMIISMLVQALYNIVDGIYVAKLSEDALTAVSLAFPAQNLMIGIATGTGVGVASILSRSLGEKDFEKANHVAGNSFVLAFFSWLLLVVFGVFFSEAFINFQTKNAEIAQMSTTYLRIVTIASLGVFGEIAIERLLQSTGRTFLSMIVQLCGAIINIILDPILIFGLLGFPKMGIAGAAVATITGQFIAMIVAIILNLKLNKEIKFNKKYLKPSGKLIKEIYIIGVPSILMVAIGSAMTFFFNKILTGFTDTAVAVFGAYFKVQSFIFMPVFGLNNGLIPIVAFNLGARKKDRIKKVIRLAMIYACSLMLIGLIIFQIMPQTLLSMFDPSADMIEIGVPALRTISLSFVFAGICIVSSSVFQAMDRSIYSLIMAAARQIIVLLPVAYLLSLTGILRNVWFAFPIAEIVSLTVSLLLLRKILKSMNFMLDNQQIHN